MKSNLGKIFKQAWFLTKTHKFLWTYGLFLSLGFVLNLVSNDQAKQVSLKISNQPILIAAVTIVIAAILYLYFRARAGNIIAVKALLDKQETSLKKSFSASKLFYPRLIIISVALSLVLIVLAVLLTQPVAYFYYHQQITQAGILGILAGLIFLPVLVVLLLTSNIAPLFVVIFDLLVQESLDRSIFLIKQFFFKIFFFSLMLALFQVVPVVILDLLTYYNHGLVIRIVSTIIYIAYAIILATYQQTAWVLIFLELNHPRKIEQEQPLPEPEMIG